jgi:ATP-dependent Clp protease ATP-binding subunit ClpA
MKRLSPRSNYHNGILLIVPDKAIDLMDEAASKNTYGNQF